MHKYSFSTQGQFLEQLLYNTQAYIDPMIYTAYDVIASGGHYIIAITHIIPKESSEDGLNLCLLYAKTFHL